MNSLASVECYIGSSWYSVDVEYVHIPAELSTGVADEYELNSAWIGGGIDISAMLEDKSFSEFIIEEIKDCKD